MRRSVLIAAALCAAAFVASPAVAEDVSVGSCAGVTDVSVGSGGVSVGGAWVNPSGCLGPRS